MSGRGGVEDLYEFRRHDVPDYVLLWGVPSFLVLMVLEFLFSHCWLQKKYFRAKDSINSLSHGLVSQYVAVLAKPLGVLPYVWIYKHYAVYRIPLDTPFLWLLILLGVDLGYYWYHRLAHEINSWWLSHAVHHSSEEYNLSTALRQSAFGVFFSWVCYLPLAFFFKPELFLVHQQINLIYQFWIHTEVVRSTGPVIEFIFNTPSHHRVHHGRNIKYLDKNYAGILIIWDRMFGTFQAEEEEPVYGLVHPLATWSVIWGQMHHVVDLTKAVYNAASVWGAVEILMKPPGWDPSSRELFELPEAPLPSQVVKYDTQISTGTILYCALHWAMVALVSITMMIDLPQWGTLKFMLYGMLFILSLESVGQLMDNHSLAWPVEGARLVLCWPAFLLVVTAFPKVVPVFHGVMILSLFVAFKHIVEIVAGFSKQKVQ